MRTSGFSASPRPRTQNSERGFTLIEILVTLSILGILSAVLVGYASESSRQTSMMITRERMIRLFSRAKSLSLSGSIQSCGYGIHVDRDAAPPNSSVFIFQDIAQDCSTSDHKYTANSSDVKLTGSLDSYVNDLTRVKFVSDPATDLYDVVFLPPNPDIYIDGVLPTQAVKKGVSFELADGSGKPATVSINNAGQISSQ